MKKLIRCTIKIKEDIEVITASDLPLEDKDYLTQLAAITKKMNEQNERFEKNFMSVINFIVANNGIICVNGRDLEYEWNLYSSYIDVKIPTEMIEVIKNHPKVEFIKEV